MTSLHDSFYAHGYVHLAQKFSPSDMAELEREYTRLAAMAEYQIPSGMRSSGAPAQSRLIAVPEAKKTHLLCRMEYLAGESAYISSNIVSRCSQLIQMLIGQPVLLFKDKCNLKHPGGGAFTPHQDITAYRHFGSRYQVTAALMLDAATKTNGCIEMASVWDKTLADGTCLDTPRGVQAILPSYVGGPRNGDIVDAVAHRMSWEQIEAAPGDVIIFDSYVPHRSGPNGSAQMRRIMFFTFNLASEGQHYEAYYQAKRENPNNPIFHVSTPTHHSSLTPAGT